MKVKLTAKLAPKSDDGNEWRYIYRDWARSTLTSANEGDTIPSDAHFIQYANEKFWFIIPIAPPRQISTIDSQVHEILQSPFFQTALSNKLTIESNNERNLPFDAPKIANTIESFLYDFVCRAILKSVEEHAWYFAHREFKFNFTEIPTDETTTINLSVEITTRQ